MTALSTLPGAMSGGLNAFSSPLGGSLPAPLLMQLLKGAGGGMPGSLAPQIPMLPGAPRGAAGPVPPIGPMPQMQQNNLLSSLGPLAGTLGKSLGGGNGANASEGLLGSSGPLFGLGRVFGTGGFFDNMFTGGPLATAGTAAPADQFGAAMSAGFDPFNGGLLDVGASGAGAAGAGGLLGGTAGAAGADAGLTYGAGMGLGTSSLFGGGVGSLLDIAPFFA